MTHSSAAANRGRDGRRSDPRVRPRSPAAPPTWGYRTDVRASPPRSTLFPGCGSPVVPCAVASTGRAENG
eukprot:1930285-Prymnesium_polylepis.1